MRDQYNREVHYMRISVTDRCNLNCRYCMPEHGIKLSNEEILSDEEILRVVRCASRLGIDTLRITGGEPLVRKGLPELIRECRQISGIHAVRLTTNGILLKKYLPELLEAGLTGVNISLDSLNPQKYEQITGGAFLSRTLEGMEAALETGISVKINCVLQQGQNEEMVRQLTAYAQNRDMEIRFIELMPIGEGRKYQGISNKEVLKELYEQYPDMTEIPAEKRMRTGAGPAVVYQIPGAKCRIGLISAIHGKFCSWCNRIRLTPEGFLKACLADSQGSDLKALMRSGAEDEQLLQAVSEVIYQKPQEHHFEEKGQTGEVRSMNQIGG